MSTLQQETDAKILEPYVTATVEDLQRGIDNALKALEFGSGIYRPNPAQKHEIDSLHKHIALLRRELARRQVVI